ncbi:hypothetical protein, partial [Vibrio parahaemolyticus]|uniref:hypothetical protein n=1 Tax=Vibrio parahaemolyticus TaxID=670 RepID=UPI001C5D4D3C
SSLIAISLPFKKLCYLKTNLATIAFVLSIQLLSEHEVKPLDNRAWLTDTTVWFLASGTSKELRFVKWF